jgi:prepilin-type N-terminal cleavage/methylation domain-containing protein
VSRCRHAFTLIEVLAVVTILAIATAAMTVGLASADANARLRAFRADLIDLDARARLFARTEGACDIRFPLEAEQTIVLARLGNEEPLATVTLPHAARVEAQATGRDALKIVHVDRSGRSVDYRVTVTMGDLSTAWTVAGLTGWVERQEVRP